MPKTVLEKIASGTDVTKEECVRSLAAHMSNLKNLLERFESDNKLFAKTPDETFKNICQNDVTACQDMETMVNQMTEYLMDRLDEGVDADKVMKDEAEKKRLDCATKLNAAKVEFADILAKYNTDKAEKEKDRIENQVRNHIKTQRTHIIQINNGNNQKQITKSLWSKSVPKLAVTARAVGSVSSD